MGEFKAKIARHSTAMAQIFNKVNVTEGNACGAAEGEWRLRQRGCPGACGRDSALGYAEIAHFTCSIANHGLFSTSQGSLGNSLRYILLSTLSNPA